MATISKKYAGMVGVIPAYLHKVAQQEMVKMVQKMTKQVMKDYYLPFNISVYVQNGGEFDMYEDGIAKLGVKVDAIYMGSSWGLLKIVFKDLMNQKKERLRYKWRNLMIRVGITKDDDE